MKTKHKTCVHLILLISVKVRQSTRFSYKKVILPKIVYGSAPRKIIKIKRRYGNIRVCVSIRDGSVSINNV